MPSSVRAAVPKFASRIRRPTLKYVMQAVAPPGFSGNSCSPVVSATGSPPDANPQPSSSSAMTTVVACRLAAGRWIPTAEDGSRHGAVDQTVKLRKPYGTSEPPHAGNAPTFPTPADASSRHTAADEPLRQAAPEARLCPALGWRDRV